MPAPTRSTRPWPPTATAETCNPSQQRRRIGSTPDPRARAANPGSDWQAAVTEPEIDAPQSPLPSPTPRRRRPERRRWAASSRHGPPRRAVPAAGWPGSAALLLAVGLVGALAFGGLLDAVVIDRGAALWAVVAVAAVASLVGLATRPAGWWRHQAPWIALGSTVVVVVAWVWLRASGLTGDSPYPDRFVVYAWVALFVLGAGLSGLRSGPHTLRTARVLSGPALVLAVFLVINSFYGYWPTLGALLGHPLPGQVGARRFRADLARDRLRSAAGELGPVSIPGTAVGFHAAPAYLWLPPAWDRLPHAGFPIIVTLTGIPGRALDWAVAGGAVAASRTWARAHDGIAPPVLMLNENGSPVRDTECVNSREGRAWSYLTQVVPRFVTRVLGIPHVPDRWGVVGFSEGGTCSLLLAVKGHDVFGTFVDIAGDAAPDFGPGGRLALPVLFDGNRAEQGAWNPRLLMLHHRYPYLEGWFATGLQDRGHHLLEPRLAAEAARAGIEVHHYWASGHHTWVFARKAFEHIYPSFVRSLLAGH